LLYPTLTVLAASLMAACGGGDNGTGQFAARSGSRRNGCGSGAS